MKLPALFKPFLRYFRRDLTVDQFAALGLYTPPAAGIHLTATVAEGISAVYCADRVISEDLAALPKVVYSGHRLDDGAKALLDDPITQLLARPNAEQTGPVFWSAMQHDANIWGFGLAEIARDGTGAPAQLWHIPSTQCRAERDELGRLQFDIPGRGGAREKLPLEDALFIPGFSPNGTTGYKLLNLARLTLGSAAAIQEFVAARFRTGFRPAGAIKVKGELSEEARTNMRASWAAIHGGPHNAGTPMLLEEDTDWAPFDLQHNDQLQLAQLAENLVTDVARFFNISPVKVHQLGRATWSNLETLNREHVTSCLGPWIAKRDAEIDAKLLVPGKHCRHIVDRLLAADTQTRFAAWASALQSGWMTRNEVRQREDLPPLPGGDDLYLPLNQGPAAAEPKSEGDNGTDPAQSAE